MGLLFSSPRLSAWKKGVMKAIDKMAHTAPFFDHDVYITTHELTNSITIHGNVYYHKTGYSVRYTQEWAEQYFLDQVQDWVRVYCGDLGDPPAIRGSFRVVGRW